MKIYIDTIVEPQPMRNDCAAPTYASSRFASPKVEPFHALLVHPDLYMQACTDTEWLVCNPARSGRLAVLDEQALHLLEQFRTAHTFKQLVERCSEYTKDELERALTLFLQQDFLAYTDQLDSSYEHSTDDTLTAWLHVTNACNLHCTYCYIPKTSESMNNDTAHKSIAAIFRSAYKQGFQKVVLKYAGGEATLQPQTLFELHDYAVSQAERYEIALHAQLLSNGVSIPQRMIEQLKIRNIQVSISLDGLAASHDSQRTFSNGAGSFRFVERTISRLLANDIVPHILVTVSQRNLAGLPELMRYLLQHDLPFSLSYYRDNACSDSIQDLQFSDTQVISTMRTVFSILESQLPRRSLLDSLIDKVVLSNTHQHTCGVGRNYMVVNQQGGVAKCQAQIGQSVTTVDVDDPLRVIQADAQGIQNLPVTEKEGCRNCSWRFWCTGGCPLLTYRATGRYDVKSPNCNIYQALIPDALRLEALRLLKYEAPVFSCEPGRVLEALIR